MWKPYLTSDATVIIERRGWHPVPTLPRALVMPTPTLVLCGQGLAGEYGVTKNHSPIISELKAGVVQITHEPVGGAAIANAGPSAPRYFCA